MRDPRITDPDRLADRGAADHPLTASLQPAFENVRWLPAERISLLLNDVKNLASGNALSKAADPELRQVADYGRLVQISRMAMTVVVLAAAIAGLVYALQKVAPKLRARNAVEAVIRSYRSPARPSPS